MASTLKSNRTNEDEVRIVMVGKTGAGKSATGNTILGCDCFKSKFSPNSLTAECTKGKATVDGHSVVVIDTPGLFDTTINQENTKKNICQSISYASPGPHIFLVVIRLGRFTEEEKQTVEKIQEIFGTDADKYSMVLFTYGDNLKNTTIEEFLAESSDLQELVARCNGQYHVFNNMLDNKLKKHSQVTELLQKIREIVQNNGGSHYTNEMFQRAEEVIEEETQRILREKEEKIRKEKEKVEREIQEKYQKEMQKYNEQLQAERERERKEREEERKREERKREEERKELKEKWEREIEEERCKIQSRYQNEARDEAERMNPIYKFVIDIIGVLSSTVLSKLLGISNQ